MSQKYTLDIVLLLPYFHSQFYLRAKNSHEQSNNSQRQYFYTNLPTMAFFATEIPGRLCHVRLGCLCMIGPFLPSCYVTGGNNVVSMQYLLPDERNFGFCYFLPLPPHFWVVEASSKCLSLRRSKRNKKRRERRVALENPPTLARYNFPSVISGKTKLIPM